MPDYPTKEDVIYELNVYLTKDGRPNGSFSLQTLKAPFGPNWEETKFKQIVDEMIKTGEFEVDTKKVSPKVWYKSKITPTIINGIILFRKYNPQKYSSQSSLSGEC